MEGKANIRTARDTIQKPSAILQIGFLEAVTGMIQSLLDLEDEMLGQMKRELSTIEPSGLHIRSGADQVRFFAYPEHAKRQIGITEDTDRIYKLARRTYLHQRIAQSNIHTRHLKRILESAEQERCDQRYKAKMKKYQDAQLDICRIFFTDEQNEWIDEQYVPNPYYQHKLKYPTEGNILMRSKSEAKLGTALEKIGIPYRYDDSVSIEEDLFMNSEKHPSRKICYADFKLPNFCGGITVHEHLGAFQIDNYSENSLKRLNDYHEFTVYELSGQPVRHSEFTFSFEYEIWNTRFQNQLIRRMLLPC